MQTPHGVFLRHSHPAFLRYSAQPEKLFQGDLGGKSEPGCGFDPNGRQFGSGNPGRVGVDAAIRREPEGRLRDADPRAGPPRWRHLGDAEKSKSVGEGVWISSMLIY